jgi:hypothetical protein
VRHSRRHGHYIIVLQALDLQFIRNFLLKSKPALRAAWQVRSTLCHVQHQTRPFNADLGQARLLHQFGNQINQRFGAHRRWTDQRKLILAVLRCPCLGVTNCRFCV